ncbi:hypothetical protein HUU39_10915, partial [candidate division KSB1 bacterium]|nr:hypothetical protein [candidate division KSB1 bacterium]
KPLAKPRDTGAWRPAVAVEARGRNEFPYQKALSSDVSRKGPALSSTPPVAAGNPVAPARAEVATMPPPAAIKPMAAAPAAADQKFGTSGLSAEEVDRIVAEFSKRK